MEILDIGGPVMLRSRVFWVYYGYYISYLLSFSFDGRYFWDSKFVLGGCIYMCYLLFIYTSFLHSWWLHLPEMAATTSASLFSSSKQISSASSGIAATATFLGAPLRTNYLIKRKITKISSKVIAVAPVAAAPVEEIKEYVLPTWAEFDLGRAPVYWKTMNGLPPTSGERLKLFYNPAAKKLTPNEEFGIAFNGGFNQPIMCGGEPRAMLQKIRGKADPPIYTILICVPKHALSLIFSFTNGMEWDGPYRLQFQVPRAWRNRPTEFFTEGLAEELSIEGACEQAIFPDANVVVQRCAMIGNLTVEGGDRCNLDFVLGCTDPSSPMFNPLANVDDGSCPPYSDSED